jgi:hypothetical protein
MKQALEEELGAVFVPEGGRSDLFELAATTNNSVLFEPIEKRGGGNWIGRIHMKKGALTRQAKRHHMSLHAYESAVSSGRMKATTTTKRRVALAKTLAGLRKRGSRP